MDIIHQIQQPVLMFFGEEDALIPNRILHSTTTEIIAKEACNKIKNCHLILIENCGHFLQFEKPEIFNQELIAYMQKLL